jgi:hypothetical protein
MATPSNALPFEITFKVGDVEKPVESFYVSEQDFYAHIDEPSVVLIENLDITVDFTSTDDSARLYMYGLETIPFRGVEVDDTGEAYLYPNEGKVELFNQNYYPLIPGTYQIRVVVGDQIWYAPFTIRPKQLTTGQLDVMREQLEEKLRGLALDFISKQFSKGQALGKSLPPKLLMQFLTITKHYPNVMAALSDLYTKVNFHTRKEYRIVHSDRANVVDEVTIRNRLKHPEQKGILKVPVRTIHYDLPENIWIKQIMKRLITILDDFVVSVEEYAAELQAEIEKMRQFEFQQSTKMVLKHKAKVQEELDRYIELVNQMKIGFQLITSAHWYDQVPDKPLTPIPYVLTKDSRYRSIYVLYQELQDEELDITLDSQYSYQWKRTDKLYEMWCYVELLGVLEEKLDYKPVRGWIYDMYFNEERMLIPSLPSGERIILEKDGLQLHLVYDGIIPLTSSETVPFLHPLFMRQQFNRPDGRLDVYKDGTYYGTVMMDFKYRPRYNFWKKDRVNTIARTREMTQLIGYSDARSNYLFGTERPRTTAFQRLSPVAEVWAFYPVKDGRSERVTASPDHNLRLIPFSPGMDQDHVARELERILEQLLRDSTGFMGNK